VAKIPRANKKCQNVFLALIVNLKSLTSGSSGLVKGKATSRWLVRSETLRQDDVVVTTQLSRATSGLFVDTICEKNFAQLIAMEVGG